MGKTPRRVVVRARLQQATGSGDERSKTFARLRASAEVTREMRGRLLSVAVRG